MSSKQTSSSSSHEIFSKFYAYEGPVDLSYDVDFIGTLSHKNFLPEFNPRSEKFVKATPPTIQVGEEYFEWIDILESVSLATDQFTMLELGAGYGRWSARAALAASQQNLPFYLGLAEAEPAHVEWAFQHMRNNNIPNECFEIFDCALGAKNGKNYFYVEMPKENNKNNPREWYGQSITKEYEKRTPASLIKSLVQKNPMYHGRKIIEFYSGWKAIKVEQRKLSNILKKPAFQLVDICDLDIQGSEAVVIQESIDLLNKQVKRLHIGTHGKDIEKKLLSLLSKNGWRLIRNYTCHEINDTEFGKVHFQDGIQTWINPRLQKTRIA